MRGESSSSVSLCQCLPTRTDLIHLLSFSSAPARQVFGEFEFLLFDETLQDLLSSGMPVAELRKVLKANNHRTLIEDGLEKVQNGTTSLEELLRVVPLRAVLAQLS